MRKIFVDSKKTKTVINLTPQIEKLIKTYPAEDGVIHLFLKHTTAALATAYLKEDLDLDLIGAYEVIIPHQKLNPTDAPHDHSHHTEHLPAHLIGSLLGPQLIIPVAKNKLDLGAFQSIVLVELNGPKKREILLIYKEKTNQTVH